MISGTVGACQWGQCRMWPERNKFVVADNPAVLLFGLVCTPNILINFKFALQSCVAYLSCSLQEILLVGQLRKFPFKMNEQTKPTKKQLQAPHPHKGKWACSALEEMGEKQVFLEQVSVWVLQFCHLLFTPVHCSSNKGSAFTAVGFILLFWHRDTNETSQPSWEAAATCGVERLNNMLRMGRD